MIEGFRKLIEGHGELASKALMLYKPIVDQYISENCQDSNKIAHTLDFMLDFCFDRNLLQLYRELCHHLHSFNPESAVFYINAYLEMWNKEGMDLGNFIE